MEEQLISFETAKLAKEKGFDWGCQDCFDANGHLYSNGWCERLDDFFKDEDFYNTNIEDIGMSEKYYVIPTQSLLQRWLRDKGLEIRILMWHCGEAKENFYNGKIFTWSPNESYDSVDEFGNWYTYEEALEYGLKQALNLIK